MEWNSGMDWTGMVEWNGRMTTYTPSHSTTLHAFAMAVRKISVTSKLVPPEPLVSSQADLLGPLVCVTIGPPLQQSVPHTYAHLTKRQPMRWVLINVYSWAADSVHSMSLFATALQ